MALGISKRDRMLRRADKVWRSIWHRQMLMLTSNRTRQTVDNQGEVVPYGVTSTDGRSITNNNMERSNGRTSKEFTR
jgi:hypothetical protein